MSDTTANERPHHAFSPSTLQYREACPYYEPTNSRNKASDDGTLQHEATDKGEDDERLSDQQAAAVAECLKFINYISEQFPGGTVIKEQYLPVDDLRIPYQNWEGAHKEIFGTTAGYLDFGVVSVCRKRAAIVDYKFGQWAVEPAKNNLQGMSYLRGLLVRFPDLEEVTVYFFMPHRDEIDSYTFKRSDFPLIYLRIRTVVIRAIAAREKYAQDKNAFENATPNVGACTFCANIGRCDAVAKIALEIGSKFSPLKIPKEINPSLLRCAVDTGEGMKVAAVIETWAKAYRAQAGAKATEEDGFVPEGYILVASQDREIVDNKKFIQVALKYLTQDEIDTAIRISITPIEELIKAKAPRGQKEATREQFDTELKEVKAVELGADKAYLKMDRKIKKKAE